MFVRINGIIDKSQTNIAANMESIRDVHEQSHEIIIIMIIIIIIYLFVRRKFNKVFKCAV